MLLVKTANLHCQKVSTVCFLFLLFVQVIHKCYSIIQVSLVYFLLCDWELRNKLPILSLQFGDNWATLLIKIVWLDSTLLNLFCGETVFLATARVRLRVIYKFFEELCLTGDSSTATTISLQCQNSNVESAYLNGDLFYLTAQPQFLPLCDYILIQGYLICSSCL